MEANNNDQTTKQDKSIFRNRIPMGAFFLFAGLFIWFVFSRNVDKGIITTFVLNPGGAQVLLPDIRFDTLTALNIISITCISLGIIQILKGFGKFVNYALFLVGILVTIGFLAWGAENTSINIGGMLRVMILRSVPITLGALVTFYVNDPAWLISLLKA